MVWKESQVGSQKSPTCMTLDKALGPWKSPYLEDERQQQPPTSPREADTVKHDAFLQPVIRARSVPRTRAPVSPRSCGAYVSAWGCRLGKQTIW